MARAALGCPRGTGTPARRGRRRDRGAVRGAARGGPARRRRRQARDGRLPRSRMMMVLGRRGDVRAAAVRVPGADGKPFVVDESGHALMAEWIRVLVRVDREV